MQPRRTASKWLSLEMRTSAVIHAVTVLGNADLCPAYIILAESLFSKKKPNDLLVERDGV